MSILTSIEGPADLKKLTRGEMATLAGELREFILENLSPIGGHLASSLGVVELTIALHAVFDSPRDKIIWDVGHQAYPHKILTGRRDRFRTIRQRGGLSGFPKISESPHDAFGTGHSSTSISAALGMAAARDLSEGTNKVVAVIGDGSLTSGMALEGLNHAGHTDKDLVVILNDNEMSISPNVGALSSYLSRMLSGDFYSRMRKEVQDILKAMPLGDQVAKLAKKVEEHVKGFISEGMLFEELGFTYIGPIDGHNFEHLLTALTNIKKFDKPTLVHVVTQKGRGYKPAEEEPSSFHGVGPFHLENGLCKKEGGVPTYTSVFGEELVHHARANPKIIAITAAMADGTGLVPFSLEFPERFFDVGIAEEHAVTFAAGLASQGFRPVVAIYSTFLQRSYDQIIHDVALQGLPVVFALDRAGLVGADGPTHHGSFDLSFLRHVPGLTVLAPSDENELRGALATALAADGPVAIRYPRGAGEGICLDAPPEVWEAGKGREVHRHGGDAGKRIGVICAGTVLWAARAAAEAVAAEGIGVTLFDARYVKPLDEAALSAIAADSDGILTVEENALAGGFGSAVLEFLGDQGGALPPMRRLGLPDRFIAHGSQAELRREVGLDAEGIAAAIRALAAAPAG